MTKGSSKRVQRKRAIRDGIVRAEPGHPLRLDLACGQNKQPGHFGIDFAKAEGVDLVLDLLKTLEDGKQWPIESESVTSIFSSHFFEHIPGLLRGKFMDEVYRVLMPRTLEGPPQGNGEQGTARFVTPYYSSFRSFQDFTHAYPPICDQTWFYFNRGFREANKLTHGHYDLKCDFDFYTAHAWWEEFGVKHEEVRQQAILHQINVVNDIDVTLTKRSPKKDADGVPG